MVAQEVTIAAVETEDVAVDVVDAVDVAEANKPGDRNDNDKKRRKLKRGVNEGIHGNGMLDKYSRSFDGQCYS